MKNSVAVCFVFFKNIKMKEHQRLTSARNSWGTILASARSLSAKRGSMGKRMCSTRHVMCFLITSMDSLLRAKSVRGSGQAIHNAHS